MHGYETVWLWPGMAQILQKLKSPALDKLLTEANYTKIQSQSTGNIYPIIGDLVEIELNILNPIQPKSMDPARLKREFGKHLTFWGSVDVQQVSPFGTADEVVREVKLRL